MSFGAVAAAKDMDSLTMPWLALSLIVEASFSACSLVSVIYCESSLVDRVHDRSKGSPRYHQIWELNLPVIH